MDYRGLVLIASGIALSVFGFQQSAMWGWSDAGTGVRRGGALLLVCSSWSRTAPVPLIEPRIFRIRPFRVENMVLGVSIVFIPVFFFASEYAQIALGKTASRALVLLYFFIGFVIASQIGGRMLDRIGAKRPVVLGCTLAAVSLAILGGQGR